MSDARRLTLGVRPRCLVGQEVEGGRVCVQGLIGRLAEERGHLRCG